LPKLAYQYTDITTVKVNIDYHIQYDDHFYSIQHYLVGEEIQLHAKEYLVEFFFHSNASLAMRENTILA